jgi:hypothetical protein
MIKQFAIGAAVVALTFTATLLALDHYFGTVNGPWISFTPTISAVNGAIGLASGGGTYKVTGSTVQFQVTVKISKNGTAAAGVQVSLPVASKSPAVVVGRDVSAGPMLQGVILPATQVVTLFTFNNGYPGGDEKTLFISGVYEGG